MAVVVVVSLPQVLVAALTLCVAQATGDLWLARMKLVAVLRMMDRSQRRRRRQHWLGWTWTSPQGGTLFG